MSEQQPVPVCTSPRIRRGRRTPRPGRCGPPGTVAACPAIAGSSLGDDARPVALDSGWPADALTLLAVHKLRACVAASATVGFVRIELDALLFAPPAAATNLTVLLMAALVPARAGTDAVAVRIFFEAARANARHEVVRVARRVERVRRLADAEMIGRATAVVATARIATFTDACAALALGASATVAILGALLAELLTVGEGRIQAEATQPQGQCSRGQSAQRRAAGTHASPATC